MGGVGKGNYSQSLFPNALFRPLLSSITANKKKSRQLIDSPPDAKKNERSVFVDFTATFYFSDRKFNNHRH